MALSTMTRLKALLLAGALAPMLVAALVWARDGVDRFAALDPAPPVAADPEPSPQAAREEPSAPAFDMAAVKAAIDLYRRGDLAGGDAAADKIADRPARAALEWAAIRLAGRDMSLQRITAFMEAHADWPMQAWLRRRREEAFIAARPAPPAVRAYFERNAPLTLGGKLALARALIDADRMAEAAALVRATYRNQDFGADTESRVIEAFPELLDAQDHKARAIKLLYAEEWAGGLRAATKAGEDWAKLAKARIAAARAPRLAAAALGEIPKTLRAEPLALLSRVQALRRTDRPVEAARLLSGLSRDPAWLGDPEAWWTERRVLIRKLLDLGEQRLAYDIARGAPAGGPSAIRLDAEFHAGWIALRFLNDREAARGHFAAASALASTSISIARAAYWQGRAAEGTSPAAEEHYQRAAAYPTTYYGQLARARLVWRDLPVRRVLRPATPPNAPALRAVELLYAAEARDLAMPLLSDLAQRLEDPAAIDALALIAAARGDVRAILTLGKTANQRGLPLDDHAFPIMGVPDVAAPGPAVERPLIFAVIRQESAFDARAISSAGARGLMQLMPATARETARRAGLGYELARLTEDPAYNARLGASHLDELMADWRGSYILAIAAYNAGGGNVRRWIEAFGDPRSSAIDPVDWIERIPFTETRNYVQRVLENLQMYRVRLGETAELGIEADLRRGVTR